MEESSLGSYGVVLPAGGLGRRMGGTVPKQLMELGGRPLWRHSVETFLQHPAISDVVLVVPTEWRSLFEEELVGTDVVIVEGGAERYQSVENGLRALSANVKWVLVHDVARPFLSGLILDSVLNRVREGACIVAKPVSDTVKLVRNGLVENTVDRNAVWLAQTPQACEVAVLRECYERMRNEVLPFIPTDEASILERYGINIGIVPGDSWNDKVTTPEDLARFSMQLAHGHLPGQA